MSVFDELVGQRAVRAQLEKAAAAARELAGKAAAGADSAMAQAWLVTGPPGSGRSVAARAFAAALECTGPEPGCGQCHACHTVMEGKHPDVESVATRGVFITVERTRELVGRSYVSPGSGPWRVVVVEDADRMLERTTNVLLKAIEEPPPFTVWILCTPSPEDVMTTIRSRCREVNLAVPSPQDVADLLVRRDGVPPERALDAALAAQSHVGRARALATDAQAARERAYILTETLSIRGAGDAVLAAHRVLNYSPEAAEALLGPAASFDAGPRAGEAGRQADRDGEAGGRDGVDSGTRGNGRGRNSGSAAKSGKKPAKKKSGAKAVSDALAAQFAEEEAELRRSLGVEEGGRVPPAVSAQITALREDQKRRATRAQRDRLDRALVDLLSLYRDVLTVQLGADVALVNRDFADRIAEVAASTSAEQSIRRMDAISQARTRLAGNVAPLLALEAMMVSLRPQG